jgi:uncharacterized protein YutE (UPF0331/DUF86 family)
MKQRDYIKNLFEVLRQLDEAMYWLKRSDEICRKIGIKDGYREEEFDAFETLTSRFSRSSDMIIQQVFRSIDKIEFETEGTLLDALNRASKRGFIQSIEEIREIRELRNDIVHEYTPTDLKRLFGDVLKYSKILFDIVERIKKYSQKFRELAEDKDDESENQNNE